MLHKENRAKIMELFFDFPREQFQLREISRKTKIAATSVKNYLDEFIKAGLILKIDKGIYPSFKSNRDNEEFRFYKKLNLLERLNESKLLEFLWEKCLPASIILFGSASIGEDIESSDIDLFIQTKETKLELKNFEKKFNRKINVFFEPDFSKISRELKNNILNGIILRGYVKAF